MDSVIHKSSGCSLTWVAPVNSLKVSPSQGFLYTTDIIIAERLPAYLRKGVEHDEPERKKFTSASSTLPRRLTRHDRLCKDCNVSQPPGSRHLPVCHQADSLVEQLLITVPLSQHKAHFCLKNESEPVCNGFTVMLHKVIPLTPKWVSGVNTQQLF